VPVAGGQEKTDIQAPPRRRVDFQGDLKYNYPMMTIKMAIIAMTVFTLIIGAIIVNLYSDETIGLWQLQ
jgi:hypothetical protein